MLVVLRIVMRMTLVTSLEYTVIVALIVRFRSVFFVGAARVSRFDATLVLGTSGAGVIGRLALIALGVVMRHGMQRVIAVIVVDTFV